MNEELKIIIAAEIEKLKKGLQEGQEIMKNFGDRVEKESKKVEKTLKTAFKVSAAAIGGLGAAIAGVTKGTEQYRENQAKLASAFEAAGGNAETAKKTYNDLYRVLGDSDQATEAAQLFAQITTNEKELAQWTKIATGVYAEFGDALPIESLAESANHTAKVGEVQGALADALEWSGVSVDEFNDQLFWCNSEEERAALINRTLNDLYADSAGLYEENNAQVLAQRDAQAQLNEALAQVGAALQPIMTAFTALAAGVLQTLVTLFTEYSDVMLVVAAALGVIVTAIGLYNAVAAIKTAMAAAEVTSVWALVAAYAAHAVAVLAALAPYVLIVAAVAAVVAAFVWLWNNCDGFREFWLGLWEKLKAAFSAFVQTLEPLWNALVGLFQEAWELIKVVWDLVKPYFEGVWNSIKAIFSVVKNVVGGYFAVAWEYIKGVWSVVVSYFTTIINNLKLTFSVVKDILTGDFKGAWEGIKKIFSNWGSFFKGLWDTVKKTFSNIAQVIADSISGAVKGAINAVLSKAVGIINGFISAINLAIGVINAIPGVNIKKLSSLSVPKMARGGVVDGATLAMIGEHGKEAVVPLENNTEWLDMLANRLVDALGGGNKPIYLQVDGKTFAQISVDSINRLTRQRGSLPLKLV